MNSLTQENPHGVQSVEMGRRLDVSSVAERDEVAF